MIDAAAIRDLVEEIIEEWEGADGSLDQEFLVGQEEHAKADAQRAATKAQWRARLEEILGGVEHFPHH